MAEVKVSYDFVFNTIMDADYFFHNHIKVNYWNAYYRFLDMMNNCCNNYDQKDEPEFKYDFDCKCGQSYCSNMLIDLDERLYNIRSNMDSLYELLKRFSYGYDHGEIHRLSNLIAFEIERILYVVLPKVEDVEGFEGVEGVEGVEDVEYAPAFPLIVNDDGSVVEGFCGDETEFAGLFD